MTDTRYQLEIWAGDRKIVSDRIHYALSRVYPNRTRRLIVFERIVAPADMQIHSVRVYQGKGRRPSDIVAQTHGTMWCAKGVQIEVELHDGELVVSFHKQG